MRFAVLLLALLAAAPAFAGDMWRPAVLRVYVAPDGRDTADGSAPGRALATLQRANDLLEELRPLGDVEIHVAPGLYRGQTVEWTAVGPGRRTLLRGRSGPDGALPLFDGCPTETVDAAGTGCADGPWFRLYDTSGGTTGLTIEGVAVRRYVSAVTYRGNREDPALFNRGNVVRGCRFREIGNSFAPERPPAHGVIRLINSRNNLVEDNVFEEIVNLSGAHLVHAVYLAHHASGNVILGNRFHRISGDPIRLRDRADGNRIEGNAFSEAGRRGLLTEWFCDRSRQNDCTKRNPECPSWDNAFRGNRLSTAFDGTPAQPFHNYRPTVPANCPGPEGRPRTRVDAD